MNYITQYVPRRHLCYIKFNWKFTHVSSCLIVKDIAQAVFRCAETIKKRSSANTVAHWYKYESGYWYPFAGYSKRDFACIPVASIHIVTSLYEYDFH